jgi:hypothetical protein
MLSVYNHLLMMDKSTNDSITARSVVEQFVSGGRAALVVAHPSHELRVYGWLEQAHPRVFIWTDGSGRSGASRLDWTTKILKGVGASPGAIYGRVSDIDFYAAVLRQDYNFFIMLTEELASELVREQIEYVAGDALEGYNVTHEVGRLMTGAAVEIASRESGRKIGNFDFTVVGRPNDCPSELRAHALRFQLGDEAFERKLAAVLSHHPKVAADLNASLRGGFLKFVNRFTEPELAASAGNDPGDFARLREYPELADRILALLEGVTIESFRDEYLRPIDNRAGTGSVLEEPAFYEAYGEKLVRAGHYQQVIRHRDHLAPLADALWNHVEGRGLQ